MKTDVRHRRTKGRAAATPEHRPAPQTSVLGKRDVVPTIAALSAATGMAVLISGVFGWQHGLAVAVITFATFVVTLTGAIIVRSGDSDHVDLVDAEDAEKVESREDDEPTVQMPVLGAVPDEDLGPEMDRPTKQRTLRTNDLVEAVFAALGATAIAELVRVFIGMRSLVGLVLWWSIAFLVLYYLLVRDGSDRDAAADRVVTVLVWAAGTLVSAVLIWMVWFVFVKGLPKLAASFFTEDLSKVGPLNPGGGAKHAIIGTLEQVFIATAVVVPIAVMTAVYLNEMAARLSRPVRFIVDAMSGLPSIVAGLLVFTIFVPTNGFSGIAGSMALAVLMLPTVTRASEEILRTIPNTLREGALALGAPDWKLVHRVVLPTAMAGLVTAAILGVARAIGETAPMLLTAFGSDTTNTSPLHGPQDDLPLFVWKLVRSPEPTQVQRGFTGALILVMLIFVLFALARYVASRGQRRLGRASS